MVRFTVSGLLLSSMVGCADPGADWAAVDDQIHSVTPGTYTADVRIAVRAFLGPVLVARARCVEEIPLEVDLERRLEIRGDLVCDLPYVGEKEVEIEGRIEDLPWIDGDTDGDLDLDWEGGFTSSTTFFGEAFGEAEENGFVLDLQGTIDAWRTAP